jgi:putative transcriptional regulator
MQTLTKWLLIATIATASTGAWSQTLAIGRVLVANPAMDDPTFQESVMMIVFHDANIGTAGIFLNRPTWVDPAEAFPDIDGLSGYDGPLYLGGPAAPTELWTLLELDNTPLEGIQRLAGPIHVSLDPAVLSAIDFAAQGSPRVRVYAGRAEWGPGQLADEIADGDWRLVSARPEDVFADDPESLWQRMPLVSDGVTASLN